MTRLTLLQLYKYLPKTNCGKCGEKTCMSFAQKLLEREKNYLECTELSEEEKNRLMEVITPPVREVKIGSGGDRAIKIGGEEVLYRHELKYYNPTAFFIDVTDTMDEKEILYRVNFVKQFEFERISEKLKFNGIAIREETGDVKKFSQVVEKVANSFEGALILWSLDAKILREGVKVLGMERRPLLYAATEDNFREVLKISLDNNNLPFAVFSNDLSKLGAMTGEILSSSEGNDQIVLDPVGNFSDSKMLGKNLEKFVMLRKSAVKKGVKEFGFPLMASTFSLWNGKDSKVGTESTESSLAFNESIIASSFIDRFCSLLILHSTDIWSLLPLLTLRQNIYTDPRVEPTTEPKLYEIGNPDRKSPVLLTSNFALTYFSVSGDLEKEKISCYLLVVDTEGLAVTVSLAAEKLTAGLIRKSLVKYGVEKKVKHRKLIIPGDAARLKYEIEDITKWEVLVGPADSSQIGNFLKEKWKT